MENENMEQEVLVISDELNAEIKAKAAKLKTTKKVKKVFPIVVAGDEFDEKEVYVVYLKEPSFKDFSKFSALGKQNEMQAMRTLANDCFLDGDKELIDDDSLFIGGLMAKVMSIVRFRNSRVVNLSKAGK